MDESTIIYDSSKTPSLMNQAWEDSGLASVQPGQWIFFAVNAGLSLAGWAWVINQFQNEDQGTSD